MFLWCQTHHMLVCEFTLIFSFKGIGRWWGPLLELVPAAGKELPMLLSGPNEVKAGEDALALAKLGLFWGSIRDSSPMTQCRRCSVAQISVICVRWVLSWCHKLPVKKREQSDLDGAAGCSAERGSWRKKFQILSIAYFCCPYPMLLDTLSGLWGHKWVSMALFILTWNSAPARDCLSSSLCLQSLHELCCLWTHFLGAGL